MFRAGLGLATFLALVGCSGDPDGGFGVEQQTIVNGEVSDDADDEVVFVTGQINETVRLACSGTLIAPNVVLTAAHCVSYQDNTEEEFSCRLDGTIVSNSPGAGLLGAPIDPDNVVVYAGTRVGIDQARGVRIFGTGSSQRCRGDVAVVVLDADLREDVAPVRFGRGVRVGDDMIALGYGDTNEPGETGRHRRAGTVLGVGKFGDDPGSGTTAPGTFMLGEGPCHGDSGGPALAAETGAVTGIYSLSIGASCTASTVRNTFTLVAPWESVIREALEFAGHEPIVEEGSGGSSGTGGSAGSEPVTGSGSRDDGMCAVSTVGAKSRGAFAWLSLALVAFAVRRITQARTQRTGFRSKS